MLQPSRSLPEYEHHEAIFLERYSWLLGWALQLTKHDRQRAEELVHDAYIQFTLTRPDLNAISNLNGYLYIMLRNLQRSHMRRSLRMQHRTLSIVDYDSAEIGLRGTDPSEQLRVQESLRQVCQYACIRKRTSKAGSVLILRFLHGYYPREIAQVMRSTREAVEERLSRPVYLPLANKILDDWSIDFILRARTAAPVNVVLRSDLIGEDLFVELQRPDLILGVPLVSH